MVTYQNAVDTYPNCKKVILQADYQPMNNNVETFTSSSKSMGRKSQLQSRLKNPIHFQEQKKNIQEQMLNHGIERQNLRNAQIKSRVPSAEIHKVKLPFMHDPEDDEKITELEEKITQDNASMEDFITLDVLYLQLDMRKKYQKLCPQLGKKFPNAPFLLFLEGFDNFMYLKQDEKVKQLFDQAILEGYASALMYMTYGNIYTRQQKYPSARKMYWKAIEIDPTYHVPWLNLSVLDMQDMDYDKAEEHLLHSLYANWKYFKAYLGIYNLSILERSQLNNPLKYRLDFTDILLIPILFAPYLDEIKIVIGDITMNFDQFNRCMNMSLEEESQWKRRLEKLWQPFRIQTFEQVWKAKDSIYQLLGDFGHQIKISLTNE